MNNKVKILTSIFTVAIATVFISEYTSPAHGNNGGANPGNTGSPGDGFSCARAGCHVGTPITEAGMITSNIPSSGYKPDSTYTITATVDKVGHVKFGFQVSPQDASGNLMGMLTATDTKTKTLLSGKYITHQATGTSGTDMRAWSFDWTAPSAGAGDVTFYGAFNAANNNGTVTGDTILLSSLVVSEDLATSIEEDVLSTQISIYPNPVASTLNVSNNSGQAATITIFDANGKQLKTVQQTSSNTSLDISNFESGIYVVQVSTSSGVVAERIVKQ